MTADGEGVECADDDKVQVVVLVHQGDEAWGRSPFRFPSKRAKSQLRGSKESRRPGAPLHIQVVVGVKAV